MFFHRPMVLLLLALPLALGWWECARQGRALVLPFDHSKARENRWLGRLVAAANVLPAILLAIAIILLAGPMKMGEPGKERRLTNIQFCLDVSGSMNSPFGEGTQYDGAMACIHDFSKHRKGDAFGLTIFGCEVLHWMPLTTDLSALASSTPFLQPNQLPRQFNGTAIGMALRACITLLTDRPEGDKMIILISDGESADLDDDGANTLGITLKEEGILTVAIHVGEAAVPTHLYDITRPTGGRVYSARDAGMLKDVFRHIDMMNPVVMKSTGLRPMACQFPFVLLGLVALSLRVGVLFGLRYTPW
jgi:Ca-activated chloride channel family protein